MSAFTKKTRGAASYYPAIPQPYPDQPGSTVEVLTALKRIVETLTGSSGPEGAHAVTGNTFGAAVVTAVISGQLSPQILPYVNPAILSPLVPPPLQPSPLGLPLSRADVLACISLEVVR